MEDMLTEYDELEARAADGERVLVQTPKPVAKVYEVQGLRGEYQVTVYPDGRAECTCPDYHHRGHERPCKHILNIRGELPQTGLRARP